MLRNGSTLWGILILTVALAPPMHADYPPPRNISEMVPPTTEDWFQYYLRRDMYRGMPRTKCKSCCEEILPILLYERWYTYLCPWQQECGTPLHTSFRGTYGIFHPEPYYIETPRIIVEFPDPNCRGSRFQFYQEGPYVP